MNDNAEDSPSAQEMASDHVTPSTSAVGEGSPGVETPMLDSPTDTPETDDGTFSKATKSTVRIQDPPVTETKGYEIVKIETKHGQLYNAIPTMPLPLAVLFCIFNIVLPGVGTLFSAVSVICCGYTRVDKPRAFGLNLLSALLQMLTFLLIVGWVWSIRWGMIFVQLSMSSKRGKPMGENLPYYVRRQSSVDSEKQKKAQRIS